MRTRGSVRGWFAVAVVTLCSGLVWVPPARASVTSDQMQIVAIQRRIAGQGAQVRSLVLRENAARARLDELNRQIDFDEQRIAADERQEENARLTLRRVGVSAYTMGDSTSSPVLDMFTENESMSSLLAHHTYIRSVGDEIANALTTFNSARETTAHDNASLHAAKNDAAHALAKLRQKQRAATAAIAAEQQTLTSIKEDLRVQLQAERETAQLAAERALARYPWPTGDGALPPIPAPTPGSYANPLRAIRGLTPERIDMGVDYSGYGPIYAIGDGIVLTTTVPGWPGGTMIVYQLTDGPANGLVVYAAEDIAPTVHIGDTVTANTVLGLMYLGPDGIETGWADPAIIGNALAGDTHEFNGTNTTAFGANFSDLLQSLGVPPGIPQNHPPTGTLPRNWPTWQLPTPRPPR
jgi:murein DD-endopeptidase MepM/ murein hydrolase activator NlpD